MKTWRVAGYRTHQLPLLGASAERLAALRAQEDEDLEVPESLKEWRRGIPDDQLPAAREQWAAQRESLLAAPDAPPDRCRDFYLRTVQVANALSREDRVEILEQAIEAQPSDSYRSVHRCLLSILAIHRGDLAAARAWLSDCAIDPPDILADSARRMAHAALAITESDAKTALHCFGDSYEAVTIAKTFRALSMVYRAHALHLAGRNREGSRMQYLRIEAHLGGHEVFARSFGTFGSAESQALLGKKVHVVWHPAYRDRALVYPRALQ